MYAVCSKIPQNIHLANLMQMWAIATAFLRILQKDTEWMHQKNLGGNWEWYTYIQSNKI